MFLQIKFIWATWARLYLYSLSIFMLNSSLLQCWNKWKVGLSSIMLKYTSVLYCMFPHSLRNSQAKKAAGTTATESCMHTAQHLHTYKEIYLACSCCITSLTSGTYPTFLFACRANFQRISGIFTPLKKTSPKN